MAQPLARRPVYVVGLCLVVVLAGAFSPAQAQRVDAAMKKLMAAGGLFQRGLYDLAGQEYAAFLTAYPTHKEATTARYGLAICRYRQNKYAQAAAALAQVLKDPAFKERDDALAVLGHCQWSVKAHAKALASFDELLAKHPQSRHAEVVSLNRAQVLHQLGKTKESLAACQGFLTKFPKSMRLPTAQYFLALAQEALNQHADAEATLTKLLADYANSRYELDATLLLGQCLESQNKLAEATAQLRKFLKAAPPDRQGEGHYNLGVVLYKSGNYPGAIGELSTVVTKHAKSRHAAPGRLQLGLAQLAAGKPAEARKTLQAVVQSDPSRASAAKYRLAECDRAEKKYASARAILDALAAQAPPPANLEEITFDRALCASALNRFDQAAKEFAAFRTKYPKSAHLPEATYRLAFSLHKLKRYAESLPLCQKAAAEASPFKDALAELLAENLFLMGKYPEAEKAFANLAKSAKTADRKLWINFRLGHCAHAAEDYPKAIGLLTAVSGNPKAARDEELSNALYLLGDAQLKTGKHAVAAATLARFLQTAKQNRLEAQFKLGLAQLGSGQPAAAERHFLAVMNSGADSPSVLKATLLYGQLAYKNKQPAKAAAALNKVVAAKAPGELTAPALRLLAWIDFDAGKYEQAAQRYGQMIQKFPKHEMVPEAAFQQAVALREAGQTAPALAAFQAFLTAHPSDKRADEAKYLVGSCLARLGQHKQAVGSLGVLAGNKATVSDSILYELAWSQRSVKDNKAAAATYRRLLAEFPKSELLTPARAGLGDLLYQDKKYSEAAKLLEQVIAAKAEPKIMSVATYQLGWCYAKLDQPQKAAGVFGSFAAQYPKDELAPSALYQAGEAYLLQEKYPEAQQHFSQFLTKYASHADAPVSALKLGEAQNAAGEYAKAAVTFKEYLTKFSKHKYVYLAEFGMGWAMENTKKYAEARQWYEKVIAKHNGPTAAKAQFQIGETHFAEKKYDQAAKALLTVTAVYAYPEWSARALYEAGRVFEETKDVDRARKQYAECLKKYKDRPEAALAQKRLAALGPGS